MIVRLLVTLKAGLKSLLLHRLRSALAMIGILIGVTAVIWLVALGEGVSYQAQKQIQELGAKNIIVKSQKPEGGTAEGSMIVIYGLTMEDMDRIETIPTVTRAVPMREIKREARNLRHTVEAQLVGCTSGYLQINHLNMRDGRFLNDPDMDNADPVCVLAAGAADALFPLDDPIGQRMQIDLDFYTVVGVTEAREASAAIGGSMVGREYNMDVYIPFTTFRSRLGDQIITARSGSRDGEIVEISQITVTVEDIDMVEDTAEIIRGLLARYHKDADYSIVVPKELLRQAEVLRAMFNVLLVLIAGISLAVGGIGIMNIMLATVTERTREIGVRRALGARRQDIVTQFLVETVVLTGIGGLMGVILGFLCGSTVGVIRAGIERLLPEVWITLPAAIQQLEPMIAPWSVITAFLISVIVGVFFGLYPAVRAANLDPIEALRHE